MSTDPAPLTDTGTRLLQALERTGPRPVLAWYGESARIELSGHVLANWVIKTIGHLHDEIALEPGDAVFVDLAPHWKRLALVLAARSLGAEVTVHERTGGAPADDPAAPGADQEPSVVITDRPGSALAQSADEVLALEAVSLAPRWPGALPPLVHDWLAEVRGSSDRLGIELPDWSGPAPQVPPVTPEVAAGPGEAVPDRAVPDRIVPRDDAGPPRLLVDGDGLSALPHVLGTLLAGGGIVCPAAAVTARAAQEEGVTARG
ncbi:TIGR03089 family protein [Brachybacterium sp.]|uniref:TIGR03089 family protein n=1 Tax=Brachybacterium sp. TaxID=1891286 RepID=UPI002ED4A9EB